MPGDEDSSIEAALKRCASEPVHRPGCIQPNGVLVAVARSTCAICYTSENAIDLLHVPFRQLNGKTLDEVFGRTTRQKMREGLLSVSEERPSFDLGLLELGCQKLETTAVWADAYVIFEFEQPTSSKPMTKFKADQVSGELQKVVSAPTSGDFYAAATRFLKGLTGYDHVMVYKLDGAGHGSVVAEVLADNRRRFLGLRFPFWDIPPQVRAIMKKTAYRYVFDVDASAVPIQISSLALPALDMTHAHLRGVSSVHTDYLRNMGTAATFSLSILDRGDLWGLIALHHFTPRFPSQTVRRVCVDFSTVFASKLRCLEIKRQMERLTAVHSILSAAWTTDDRRSDMTKIEQEGLQRLAHVLRADGIVEIKRQEVTCEGLTLDVSQLLGLLQSTDWDNTLQCFSFDKVPSTLSSEEDVVIGSLLAVRLAVDYFLVFVRQRVPKTVTWAGSPEKTVVSENGEVRLRPRQSFEEFAERNIGRTEEWSDEDLQVANEIKMIAVGEQGSDTAGKLVVEAEVLNQRLERAVHRVCSGMAGI